MSKLHKKAAKGLVPWRMARIPHHPSPPWCQTTAPSSSGGSRPSCPGSWRLAPLQPNSEMEGHAALCCRPAAACAGNVSGGGGGDRRSVLPQKGSSAALLASSPASSASSSCPRQSSSVCDWRVRRAPVWRGSIAFTRLVILAEAAGLVQPEKKSGSFTRCRRRPSCRAGMRRYLSSAHLASQSCLYYRSCSYHVQLAGRKAAPTASALHSAHRLARCAEPAAQLRGWRSQLDALVAGRQLSLHAAPALQADALQPACEVGDWGSRHVMQEQVWGADTHGSARRSRHPTLAQQRQAR